MRDAARQAGLAQLVVHLICNQGVGGSIPSAGTNFFLWREGRVHGAGWLIRLRRVRRFRSRNRPGLLDLSLPPEIH